MAERRCSSHPKPWMEESHKVTVEDLENLLSDPNGVMHLPSRSMDEVFPRLYIGEHRAAANVLQLQNMNFTHVLNTAQGTGRFHSNTNHVMYAKAGIQFMGIPADDTVMFNFLPRLEATSKFIHKALSTPDGKILVNCRVGASRSATVVLAYLMLKQNKSVTEAVQIVRSKREIVPNAGFLRQLCRLQDDIDSNQISYASRFTPPHP